MRTMWKFKLAAGNNVLTVPHVLGGWRGACHVGMQGNAVHLWAPVDTEMSKHTAFVDLIATGDEIPSGAVYLGTAVYPEAVEAWHAYWRPGGKYVDG